MATWLYTRALRYPRATILAGLLVTLLAGTGLFRLTLDVDGAALVSPRAPEVLEDHAIRAAFDLEDPIAVVLESNDEAGIFNPGTLRLLAELTRDLQALPDVDTDEVTSLATERSQRRGSRDALDFETFLDPLPQSPAEIADLRAEVAQRSIYSGTLISKEKKEGSVWRPRAAAILVGAPADVDRVALVRQIRAVLERHGESSETLHLVGAPVAESFLGLHILEDLTTLVPLAIVLMGLGLYWRYRRLAAVFLPLGEVGACLIFVFGLMGHAGIPVSLTITVMPVILTALGIADEIHVFDRYARSLGNAGGGREPGPDERLETLRATLDEMWRPVVKTSVTTAIAFLSFLVSPIGPVRHFGLFTALGVIFCMLWTLTVIPACLTFVRRPARPLSTSDPWPRLFARLWRWMRPRRRAILSAGACTVLALPWGWWGVEVQDSWISGFARGSVLRQSTETVNRLFHGTHLLFVEFDTAPLQIRGELRPVDGSSTAATGVPERLILEIPAGEEIDPSRLLGERALVHATPRSSPPVQDREIGVAEANLVAEVIAARRQGDSLRLELALVLDESRRRFLGFQADPGWTFTALGHRLLDPTVLERLRDTASQVAALVGDEGGVLDLHSQLATARGIVWRNDGEPKAGESSLENRYLLSILRRIRGQSRIEEMIDEDHTRALIGVFLENANFITVRELLEALRQHERAELIPAGIELAFAGDVAVSQSMIGAIVKTQVYSVLLSLLGIFLAAGLLARSAWLGALCLLPPAFAIGAHFSSMGWAGIPLGVATSMFAAMTIGIGVDFAIHLSERYRATWKTFPAPDERMAEALAVTGPAIAVHTAVIVGGFGVMLLSRVPANGRLGFFVATSVTACFFATVIVLPLLLVGRNSRESAAMANPLKTSRGSSKV